MDGKSYNVNAAEISTLLNSCELINICVSIINNNNNYCRHLVLRIIPQSENEVESVLQAQRIAEEKGVSIYSGAVS